jgi:hypothetical protein
MLQRQQHEAYLPGARHAQVTPVVSIRQRCRARLVVRAGLRRSRHDEVGGGMHEAAASTRLTVAAVAAASHARKQQQQKRTTVRPQQQQQGKATQIAAAVAKKSGASSVVARQSKGRHSTEAVSSGAMSAQRREEQHGGKIDFASTRSAEDKTRSCRAHVGWRGHRGVVETGAAAVGALVVWPVGRDPL